MDVGLAIESDASVDSYTPMICAINNALKLYFSGRDYGEDLQYLGIGLIITGSNSEKFHPIRPFKYEKESFYKDIFTNQRKSLKNAASYDVKPDFERFCQMELNEARSYLVQLLVESTEILERNLDKFPQFDFKQFRNDFSDCLTQ